MSIDIKHLSKEDITIETDTPGGDTYFVKLPNHQEPKAICFRNMANKPGMKCTNPAGYDTWHLGTGACKFHGGSTNSNGGQIKTGKNAKVSRFRLESTIREYLEKDKNNLLDLSYELAVTKALFHEFLQTCPDVSDEKYIEFIYRYNTFINTLSGLVEKISRIDTRNTLTAAQVLYLKATVADLFMKYIPDVNDRERAAKELTARMGGAINTEVKTIELSLPEEII